MTTEKNTVAPIALVAHATPVAPLTPVAKTLVAKTPAGKAPAVKTPTAKTPAAKNPAVKKAASEKTVVEQPALKRTIAAKTPKPATAAKKPTVKPLVAKTPVAKSPTPNARASTKLAKASAAAKAEKAKKPKLMRDSFTIPKAEYVVLEDLKQRAAKLTRPAKKSELLRAGIKALAAMSNAAFLTALEQVPAIKTGRPAAGK